MNTEALVINAVCKNKDLAGVLAANVSDLFVTHGDIWKSVVDYYSKYQTVPSVELLQERFPDFDAVTTNGPTGEYVDKLRDEWLRGKLDSLMVHAGKKLTTDSSARILEQVQAELAKLNKHTNNVRDLDITDWQQAEDYYDNVRRLSADRGGSPGIPTLFKSIDSAYQTGMAAGHLIVCIGWPGKAKTWFTGKLAINAWKQGFKPMIVSLEMSEENMRDRLYTMMGEGKFRNSELQRGYVHTDKFRAWAKSELDSRGPIVVVSNQGVSDMTPQMVQAKIDQHKPDLLVMDYHQLFMDNGRSQNDVARAKNLSREFKGLATANKIPVIDITAATQEQVSDRDAPPQMSQVAWSKAIEYDADMAFAVHRYEDSGLVNVTCRKNRHGDLFDFYLKADIDTGVWTETFDGP